MAELNEKEFKDFNEIVQNILNSLIDCADKHNIDRDSFIKYFSAIFGTMVEVSTFANYTRTKKKEVGKSELLHSKLQLR
jgi:hypothetical protein